MPLYSLCLATTITTIASPAMDFKAGSIAPRVMELGVLTQAATASTYGVGRSGNTPTQTGGVLVQAENPSDPAGQTSAAVAWSTAPTVPAQFFRRFANAAFNGTGFIYTFPRGLTLQPAGPSLVIWNIATNSALSSFWITVDE